MSWREGSNQTLTSRFAAVRIRPASRAGKLAAPHPLEWLLIEWPEGEREPTKYWLSTLPEDTPIEVLVDTAKLRWRIECDYEELKSELGLAHFEGRGWRGFHHHATLCIAAYGFLIRERAPFPPQDPGSAKALAFPVVHDPEAPPIRPERHVEIENSIATMRKRLTVALARFRSTDAHAAIRSYRSRLIIGACDAVELSVPDFPPARGLLTLALAARSLAGPADAVAA